MILKDERGRGLVLEEKGGEMAVGGTRGESAGVEVN